MTMTDTHPAPTVRLTAGQHADALEAHAAGERPSIRPTLEQHADFKDAGRLGALGPALDGAVDELLRAARTRGHAPDDTSRTRSAAPTTPDPVDPEWRYLDQRDAPAIHVEDDSDHPGALIVTCGRRFGLANMDRIAIVGRWAHLSNGRDHLLVHRCDDVFGRCDTLVALGARTLAEHGADFGLDEVVVVGEGSRLTTRMALSEACCPVQFTEPTDDATAAKLVRNALEEYRRTRIVAAEFSLHAPDGKAVTVRTGHVGGNRDDLLRHLEAVAEHVERHGIGRAKADGKSTRGPGVACASGTFDDDIPF